MTEDENQPRPCSRDKQTHFPGPKVREFLWFCLPALLLGLALRILMEWQMPYGYMQFDSADFLATAHRFITKGGLGIHPKRTFLVPILYTAPFVLKIRALVIIPIAQHLLGLGVIIMAGTLTRFWLPAWRWALIPLTVALAANPNLLWFEHALMSESVYLFCTFVLALAGTLYTQRQTLKRFAFLLTALFFTAAARPEGRLFLVFGFLLLLLLEWGEWKKLWPHLAWLTGLALLTLPLTRTGQAGQLLYATVLPLAPDESKVDPEFGRQVLPLRDRIRAQRGVNTELQSLEQTLAVTSEAYLEAKGIQNPDANAFCQRMAIEACLHRPLAVAVLAFSKFLLSTSTPVSVGYESPRLQEKLNVGFNRKNMLGALGRGLVGHDLSDPASVSKFVQLHYRPLVWYPFLQDGWSRLTLAHPPTRSGRTEVPQAPAFFLCSWTGMIIAIVVPGRFAASILRGFPAWGAFGLPSC